MANLLWKERFSSALNAFLTLSFHPIFKVQKIMRAGKNCITVIICQCLNYISMEVVLRRHHNRVYSALAVLKSCCVSTLVSSLDVIAA
jgi:hypothetical protein